MDLVSVILAAGFGTRMKSPTPKVLHELAGQPILGYLLDLLDRLGIVDQRVVVSKELMNSPKAVKLQQKYKFQTYEQIERLGTGHALACAVPDEPVAPLLVLYGDAPLIKEKTLKNLYSAYKKGGASVALLAFNAKNPKGYGRVVTEQGELMGIVEEKDATTEQKNITLCNFGAYIIDSKVIKGLLNELKNNNNSGEYYLPDIIKAAKDKGLKVIYSLATEAEALGINNRIQLAAAEKTMQNRLRNKAMKNGVTLEDPKTVYFSYDTIIGKDTVVCPNVYFGLNVKIGEGCEILPFSHIAGATVHNNCKVGPFARIRPETTIGENSRIGNFVELKAVELKENVKASHLSYLGDGVIGENSNIGAGTIFCNYDGFAKHQTQIGRDVFIGSNVALVAPIQIGDRAIVGAGSVVTEDVENDALSIGRARQVNFKQKAELIRKKKSEDKK